ncbi:MAG: hypothetical protein R1F52_06340 [Candidatus Nitrosoabyssus spongiisocia]|nr:MAG: hypothetical protein R1F52_06340 [Nitrosopumilaceae archaeon AB1(1)]
MSLSESNKKFLLDLIDYYAKSSSSYKHIATSYSKEHSLIDTTFGIILGCLYSSFLQMYSNQKLEMTNQDMTDFNMVVLTKAGFLMDAIKKQ